MTRFGVAFISDRGDKYLPDCVTSFHQHVAPLSFSTTSIPVIFIDDQAHRLGMAGAVREAWARAIEHDLDFLLHVEEDFRFVDRFSFWELSDILLTDKWLAQVVLKRQPWSPEEHQAGGIIECHPGDYKDCSDRKDELQWVEHQRIFSLNPCLIPRTILEMGWPDGNEAEMTDLLVSKGYRFAFYGRREDPPRVLHVGHERSAGWRL